jgi:hypothetical protein
LVVHFFFFLFLSPPLFYTQKGENEGRREIDLSFFLFGFFFRLSSSPLSFFAFVTKNKKVSRERKESVVYSD